MGCIHGVDPNFPAFVISLLKLKQLTDQGEISASLCREMLHVCGQISCGQINVVKHFENHFGAILGFLSKMQCNTPNCGVELGLEGSDFLVTSCGHAFCSPCASNICNSARQDTENK